MTAEIKKPIVDTARCMGCGTCQALCGATFAMGDDGRCAVLVADDYPAEAVTDAIESCPTGAISWSE